MNSVLPYSGPVATPLFLKMVFGQVSCHVIGKNIFKLESFPRAWFAQLGDSTGDLVLESQPTCSYVLSTVFKTCIAFLVFIFCYVWTYLCDINCRSRVLGWSSQFCSSQHPLHLAYMHKPSTRALPFRKNVCSQLPEAISFRMGWWSILGRCK